MHEIQCYPRSLYTGIKYRNETLTTRFYVHWRHRRWKNCADPPFKTQVILPGQSLVDNWSLTLHVSAGIIHCTCTYIINPRRACATRITVVGSVCLSVSQSVSPLMQYSPLEHLFVLKTIPTYSAGNDGQNVCRIFLETVSLRSYGTFCSVWLSAYGHFSSLWGTVHTQNNKVTCVMYRKRPFFAA